MKSSLEQKVEARLIKWGSNPINVKSMMAEHFAYASDKYTGVSTIADVIRTIY
tara:strand:- start:6735 stop:6893 length:159 start_codon:yes stop_codon:yes gene_type:complete